jgi:hypothetical protein
MAYLHKDDIVMIRKPDGGMLQARVIDMRFRRFRSAWKDKHTGEKKTRWKAVPYAVCSVFIGAPVGTEFLIPGYKLRNEVKDGETLLVLRDQYAAEFNGEWVEKILSESKEKRAI